MSLDLDIHLKRGRFTLEIQATAPAGVTVFFGPSGSGKTTLLRAVAGLEAVDRGQIVIEGSDMTERPAHRRAVGYLFQEPRLLPHLNVLGNLKFAQKLTIDEVKDMPKVGFSKMIHNFTSVFHYNTWAWISVLLSTLFLLFFMGYYFSCLVVSI